MRLRFTSILSVTMLAAASIPSSFLCMPVHADSIAFIEQAGNFNSSALTQGGFKNEGIVVQLGDDNSADLAQENPQAGLSGNRAVVNQGGIEECIGCVATVTQTGSNNFTGVYQEGEANEATANQSTVGNDNDARMDQFGNRNKATFNQEGDNNIGISEQFGDDNGFVVNQLNGGNVISVLQYGGAGSEASGGPITVTQEGGGTAFIVQESITGN